MIMEAVMKRGEFLKLIDLASGEFDSRRQRGQLPYGIEPGKWSSFSPHKAFLILVTNELVKLGFLLRVAASSVHSADAHGDFDNVYTSQSDIFFGEIEKAVSGYANPPRVTGYVGNVVGPLDRVIAALSKQHQAKLPLIKVRLVNVSDVWRLVDARAAENKIDVSDVFGKYPGDED
jgi:hypothetical protein